MSDKNLAAVLHKAKDLRLQEHPISEPGPGQVQLCMSHVGICGTDVHYWQNGAIGPSVVKGPVVPGHEGSGVVCKVGEGVTNLKVGDRVTIEPLTPCWHCDICKGGRYNLCKSRTICSIWPFHGMFQRYHVHAAELCFKIPDNVSMEEAAYVEPLAFGLHSCVLGDVKLGSNVLILGSGPIGFGALLAAKAMGASKICITGKKYLDLAKDMGANFTIKVTGKEDPKELALKIEETMGCQPDCAIDCVGCTDCVTTSIHALMPGGTLALAGLRCDEASFPLPDYVWKEIKMVGISLYANRYPTAIDMIASGKVNVKPVITHTYKLEEIQEAYEKAHSGEAIKVMVKCSKN